MDTIKKKKNIREVILSVLLTIVINEILKRIYDFSTLMPTYMYAIAFIVEAMLVFMFLKKLMNNWSDIDKYIISILYFAFILLILLGRYGYGGRWVQLNPMACFREFYYGSYYEKIIFAFNIVSFVPVPIFIEVFTRDIRKSVILSVLFGIAIEALQFITYSGVFDLGDMTLYFVGICIGYAYMKNTAH